MTEHAYSAGPLRIHFVCTANICRSAYCQARAAHLFNPSRFEVSSSGIQAEEGVPMWGRMRRELKHRQSEVPATSSTQTTIDAVQSADLILTMTADQRDAIVGWWPQVMKRTFTLPQFVAIASGLTWDDPTMGPRQVVDKAFQHRSAVGTTHDIEDPYRQSAEVVRACADELDGLLEDLEHMLTPVKPRRAAE
ncbi:protein tyrosine phosphatase [Cutibacterium equinum]|uniref:Protein tyrosine phosphatase n=1 Tax=Cutibacterium equinum TaxID=3016342 RepID=A0ABY7R051_9ACTN|nr:protein tyrosine phosphatase [Cutibacterium equinum]WCC80114.1 protein tyrosine phosphatase [Cutibacterium equinum]